MTDPDCSIEIKHRNIQVFKSLLARHSKDKPRQILAKLLEKESIILKDTKKSSIRNKIKIVLKRLADC